MQKKGILSNTEAILAGLIRLIPHPFNFTPVGGLALYSGARVTGWKAFALPFAIMAATDVVLHFTNGYAIVHGTTPFVYGAFAISILLGRTLLRTSDNALQIFSVATLGSVQFFLITNVGTWLTGGIYPQTMAGLTACFVAAIPFYGATILGDLFFTGLLFGAHRLIADKWLPGERAEATA